MAINLKSNIDGSVSINNGEAEILSADTEGNIIGEFNVKKFSSNGINDNSASTLLTLGDNGKVGIGYTDPLPESEYPPEIQARAWGESKPMVYNNGGTKTFHGYCAYQGTYIRKALLLFKLDNDNRSAYRMVNGRFTKHRTNGCCTQKDNILDIHVHKTYNSASAEWYVRQQNNIDLISVQYNGSLYAAINLNYGLPHGAAVFFEGIFADTDGVFCKEVPYYDTRGEVVNAEVNDSLTVLVTANP